MVSRKLNCLSIFYYPDMFGAFQLRCGTANGNVGVLRCRVSIKSDLPVLSCGFTDVYLQTGQ